MLVISAAFALLSCTRIAPFSVVHVDRNAAGTSAYPIARDPARVGTFPGNTKSGAGHFYDDILEYRVWLHPERGARRLAGDADYFAAFARYEAALAYASRVAGAEAPLALIRQLESVDEPTPGRFTWVKTQRVTEWQVQWLNDSHRESTSIPDFLAAHGGEENARR